MYAFITKSTPYVWRIVPFSDVPVNKKKSYHQLCKVATQDWSTQTSNMGLGISLSLFIFDVLLLRCTKYGT
jgi:hypothetical protein